MTADQLSLILGPNYVLSFQETPGDCLDPVRERIRGGKGRIRKLGPDYLAYALIDAVVDNYFFVPITFLVGLYGMNFRFMPEIKWRWGYPFVWVLIVGSVAGMFAFFRKKRWL